MEFTALWDNINLASRLEWVNKYYGTNICVSEAVYESAKSVFNFRYLDTIQVKGKDVPVKIYELRGYISDLNDTEHKFKDVFELGIRHYQNKDFKKTIEIFSAPELQNDSVAALYKARCEDYISNPPEDNWTWVWRLTEK